MLICSVKTQYDQNMRHRYIIWAVKCYLSNRDLIDENSGL